MPDGKRKSARRGLGEGPKTDSSSRPPAARELEAAAAALAGARGRDRGHRRPRRPRLPGTSSHPQDRRVSEHVEQAKLVARLRHFRPEVLVFAIPNGGLRDRKTAGRLRAEGVLAGVPDLLVAEARGPWHGLFLEMKAQGGRERDVQRRVHAQLRRRGYRVEVGWGVDDAWRKVCAYLEVGDLLG